MQQEKNGDWVTIPTWLWVSVGTVALLVTGGIGTLVGNTLRSHGDKLVEHGNKLSTFEYRVASLERIQEKTEGKLDRILEHLESRQ